MKSKKLKKAPAGPRCLVRVCPGCGLDLTAAKSVIVLTRGAKRFSDNVQTCLDRDGFLQVENTDGLGSPECSSCSHDLDVYLGDPPGGLPVPWSIEGVVGLVDYPPGDVADVVKRLCLNVSETEYEALVRGQGDLVGAAKKVLEKFNSLVLAWAGAADGEFKKWMAGDTGPRKKHYIR